MGGTSVHRLTCACISRIFKICLLHCYFCWSGQSFLRSVYSFAVLCSPLWLKFVLYVFWGRRSFIDPILVVIFAWFSPCFWGWFLANPSFSLRDINLTLGLLPPRRQKVWRDSVGVESSRLRFTPECKDIFRQSFLWLLRHTDEPQKGRNSCLWLHPTLFWVLLVSCWCLAKLIFP